MAQDFVVAIPSRFASTRLAGKALADIAGEPMIVRVCKQALTSQARLVMPCVDDERIAQVLQPLAVAEPRLKICMTSSKPRSGTERIAEMIHNEKLAPSTVVINVQGDEPLINASHINAVYDALVRNDAASMSTLCAPITEVADVFDPNCVKLVLDHQGYALYFSRAPIPYERDNFSAGSVSELKFTHYHHIGIYGYRAEVILDYLQREPAEIETCESLEQLRLLHYGMRIVVAITNDPPEVGVDTAKDLQRVNAILKAQ